MLETSDESTIYGKGPSDGMYVRGLFLEGAVWSYESGALNEATPKVLYGVMPLIWFKPCARDNVSSYQHYKCPMYRTGVRRGTLATTGHSTNFVMVVRLPSTDPEAHWVKRGTGLLTTLAD